jgi:hypothetical protein
MEANLLGYQSALSPALQAAAVQDSDALGTIGDDAKELSQVMEMTMVVMV